MLRNAWPWLTYQYGMWKLGVSEAYIRESFSALCELDVDEFKEVPHTHRIEFKAWGNEVHIKAQGYECVIKEGIGGCIYVDEWRTETRMVKMEFGSEHETHWHEVYRTGKHIESARFVHYLRLLYGAPK